MSYLEIPSRRMAYDIDGTEIAICDKATTRDGNARLWGLGWWLTAQNKNDLNNQSESPNVYSHGNNAGGLMLFMPEKREITHLGFLFNFSDHANATPNLQFIQASNNTTNGMDGDWETGVYTQPDWHSKRTLPDRWRSQVFAVSFSEPKKVLYIGSRGLTGYTLGWAGMHVYGSKAVTETPDDILILENATDEFTALKEWGNRPEGTVEFSSFRLKNDSPDKIANDINVQFNHDDFLLSWSEDGPWVAFVDIASLSPGAVSSPIYIKNELPPPLLTLGPKAGRVIVGVGYWS